MINWKQVASEYNLTPEEFEEELYIAIASVGTIRIDSTANSKVVYDCADSVSNIKVTVERY